MRPSRHQREGGRMNAGQLATAPLKRVAKEVDQVKRLVTRFVRRSPLKPGASPGTLIPVETRKIEKPRITYTAYDTEKLKEEAHDTIDTIRLPEDALGVHWINIDGLHDTHIIEAVGSRFGIHPLTLEDILNTGHRPKAEIFDDYLFLVFKMLYYDSSGRHIETEQVSIVLLDSMLISFQEMPGDVFAPVRDRIKKGKGRIRKAGCDYLAYALMDAVVDHYFVVLDAFGEKIENMEGELLADPEPSVLQRLYNLKREIIFFRKQVWPIRELLNTLIKQESPFIDESVHIFLRDVYDHTIQVIDTIESFRDVLSGLLDIYLSTVSNKMNEVMKVLTVIATIFIPLTFIAGIDGMNFQHMPELEWRWAYPALWGVLIAIFLAMFFWFKKKKWF
jgi:magnesium transporter